MFTVNGSLKIVLYTLTTERDRLKTALESDSTFLLNLGASMPSSAATGNMVASLRNSLNQALQQNADLRLRLARIHDTADLSDISSVGPASEVVSFTSHWIHQLEKHSSQNQAIPARHQSKKWIKTVSLDAFFYRNFLKSEAGICCRK